MKFRNGLFSFLVSLTIAILLITIGSIILIKVKNTSNIIKTLGIIIILLGVIVNIVANKICFTNKRSKESVNISPIMDLKIHADLKNIKDIISSLDSVKLVDTNESGTFNTGLEMKRIDGIIEIITGVNPEYPRIDMEFSIFNSKEYADSHYKVMQKVYRKRYGIMKSGNNLKDKYFVTYNNQMRADLGSMFLLTDMYVVFTIFKKSNLIIKICETKLKKCDTNKMNRYISLISEKLSAVIT